jgi:hypothetical protein
MKKFNIEITENDDETIAMNRTNNGFKIYELLGFLDIMKFKLFEQLKIETENEERI